MRDIYINAGLMKYLIALLSVSASAWSQELPVVQAVSFKQDTFNILTYGAKADGVSLNTSAIARAIFTCNKMAEVLSSFQKASGSPVRLN
jgi:DNA sulfur modification protein DndE